MGEDMILLRAVDDNLESWKWMSLEEFLEKINLGSWNEGQQVAVAVLPQARQNRLS